MTIDEAIRARYDRFNRLRLAAEGHTFEDDPKVTKEEFDREMPAWEEKVNNRAHELGFENHDAYWAYVCKKQWEENDPTFERDPIIQKLWEKQPHYSSLYDYEKMCIDEAKGIAEFITNMGGDVKENWEKIRNDSTDSFEFMKGLKEAGYEMDEGHSGNSASMSILFANSLLFNPDIFPYLHGALAALVGDKGYHDDRSDLPKTE
jgi:hypothetical protein